MYILRLSPERQSRSQVGTYSVAEATASVPNLNYTLVDEHLSESGEGVCYAEHPISVALPPMPKPEPVEEAHLYLSRDYLAGRGNHSVVYNAEWEVPRSTLMPPSLCQECVREDVAAILKEQYRQDETSIDFQGTATTASENVSPGHGRNKKTFTFHLEGPARSIITRVRWRSADEPYYSSCSHNYPRHPYPSATKVRVIAKLSLPNDRHLATEAMNYQTFPLHFFKHWEGRTVIPPLNDPTPAGALAPQFYGFYVPEQDRDEYLSPIMLLEDCGVPVDPSMLNVDEK